MTEPTPARRPAEPPADRPDYRVRRIEAGEWRELRALRLEALTDTPTAFSTSRAADEALPDGAWQAQAAAAATGASTALFVAVGRDGSWLGMAGAAPVPDVPDHAHVYSVYVTPAHRGRSGPAADLVTAAVGFARARIDVGHLTLGVHEANARAQSFYHRLGFVPTGLEVPYPLDPAERLRILGYPGFRAQGRSTE
ncbi:GNAT family N-acetyltransferase [Streptacidiphilus anmyonensis]|uniref:GNAT family N-acetyltransferase n=1 Tax=Streptacidiphilus anmyonensis TaxID=405782 RepID=UPI0005AA1198|nr:GNAT family N-acetyltransferase [Streptacidiphilus anmyonensis]